MELFKAHEQWAKRPADERMPSLQAMYDACRAYAATAHEAEVPFNSLRAEVDGRDLVLVGRENVPARLTNWAFGQLAARAGAPASYITTLPATLAMSNINYGLKKRAEANPTNNDTANLLLHRNGGMLCRALTTDKYERIWNYEVAERILQLAQYGWEPARPDIRKSIGDFPALYVSDRDMFAFLRLPNVYIPQPVPGAHKPIYKGLIYWNSEVGDKKIGCMKFGYSEMCGNHIIWNASEVSEFSARHVGNVRGALRQFEMQIRRYADESTSDMEATFKSAHTKVIASTKEGVLDYMFGRRDIGLSRKVLDSAYEAVVPEEDGDPKTVWGMVQGLTRHSQTIPYADQRQTLDRAVPKILKIAF